MDAPPAPPAGTNPHHLKWILLGCGGVAAGGFVLCCIGGLLFWGCHRRPESPEAGKKTWTITAAGGTVGEPGSAQIQVPAGAVGKDAAVALTPQSSDLHPAAGIRIVGRIWSVRVDGADHYSFAKPVRVSLPIDSPLLAKNAPVVLSRWDGRGWQRIPGSTVEGNRVQADVDHFSDVAPTQDDAPAPKTPAAPGDLLNTEFWNAFVDIDMHGSRSRSTPVSSASAQISRSASMRLHLGTRVPAFNSRATWVTSFDLGTRKADDQADVDYQIDDHGYTTDDDNDHNGNVFYYYSWTTAKPPQPRATGRLEIDAAAGTLSFTAGASDPGKVHYEEKWTMHTPPKPYDTAAKIQVRLKNVKFSVQDGTIQLSVPMTREMFQDSLGPTPGFMDPELRGTINVTLSPGPPFLARIRPPYMVKRAEVVTLDGSASLGNVTEYRWTVEVDYECPAKSCATMDFTGPKVSFTALWGFMARLTIKDAAGNVSTTQRHFDVRRRDGPEWRTQCKTPDKLSDPIQDAMLAESMQLGVNQCAKHPKESTSGHMLHTMSRAAVWYPSEFSVKSVQDSGPFNGVWYVSSQKLEIDRAERVNKHLMTQKQQLQLDYKEDVNKSFIRTGDVYELNLKHHNAVAVGTLLAQVTAHEKAHSTLLQRTLDRMTKEERDPASLLESTLGLSEEKASDTGNKLVRQLEADLQDATSEAAVKAELDKSAAWRKPLTVWFPSVIYSAGEKEVTFPKMSQIGDDYSDKKPDGAADDGTKKK